MFILSEKRQLNWPAILIASFVFFLLMVNFKNALSGDERRYLAAGTFFLDNGFWPDTKLLPLYSILIALLTKLFHNQLLSAKILYVACNTLLCIPLINIFKHYLPIQTNFYGTIITLLTPGLVILPLYSGTHPLFVFLAYLSLSLTISGIDKNTIFYFFTAGLLIGLASLTRLDGLVYFVCILGGLVLCHFLNSKSNARWLSILMYCSGCIVVMIPWEWYLLKNGHIVSTVIHWNPSPTAAREISLLMQNLFTGSWNQNEIILKKIVIELVLMIKLYSESLASVRYVPIFLWIFLMLGLLQFKFKQSIWILLIPVVASFSYLFFYVSFRYLIPMIPIITYLGATGIYHFAQLVGNRYHMCLKYGFLTLTGLLLLTCCLFYGIYGNITYQKNSTETAQFYHDVVTPSHQPGAILIDNSW